MQTSDIALFYGTVLTIRSNVEVIQWIYNVTNGVYRVSQKKYTSLKSELFVLRTDQSVKLMSFVRQVQNLDFDT